MSYDFDYFDMEDFGNMTDNNFYLDLADPDTGYITPEFEGYMDNPDDPFWQTPTGMELSDYINFGDPFGNGAEMDFSQMPTGLDNINGYTEDGSGGTSGVGGALNWLGKLLTGEGSGTLADLLYGGASAYLMGNQVAQQNQNTDLLQKALSLQNASTQNSIKHSDINQFSALTNNAGNMTNNAYDVGYNDVRMNILGALMKSDKNLQGIDPSGFLNMSANLRNTYEPTYQGYANDFVNHRNTIYPTEYASTAPFTSAAGGGGLNQVASAPNSFADLYGG